jgi:hypothetical protein
MRFATTTPGARRQVDTQPAPSSSPRNQEWQAASASAKNVGRTVRTPSLRTRPGAEYSPATLPNSLGLLGLTPCVQVARLEINSGLVTPRDRHRSIFLEDGIGGPEATIAPDRLSFGFEGICE